MLSALSLRWGKPIAWINRNLSLREWFFWRRLFFQQPFDDRGIYFIPAAIIASAVTNATRMGGEPVKPSDFMPFDSPVQHEPTDAEVESQLLRW